MWPSAVQTRSSLSPSLVGVFWVWNALPKAKHAQVTSDNPAPDPSLLTPDPLCSLPHAPPLLSSFSLPMKVGQSLEYGLQASEWKITTRKQGRGNKRWRGESNSVFTTLLHYERSVKLTKKIYLQIMLWLITQSFKSLVPHWQCPEVLTVAFLCFILGPSAKGCHPDVINFLSLGF